MFKQDDWLIKLKLKDDPMTALDPDQIPITYVHDPTKIPRYQKKYLAEIRRAE